MPVKPGWSKRKFSLEEWPSLPCPSCSDGALVIDAAQLKEFETAESKRAYDIDGWEPHWTTYRFVGVLRCTSAACVDEVVVIGAAGTEMRDRGDGEAEYFREYDPFFYEPAPVLIAVPVETPELVRSNVVRACRLFWSDASASASACRAAIERLMDHLKVPKTFLDTKGKRRRSSLDSRIKTTSGKHPRIAQRLLAAKWIGNDGTHEGLLVRSDAVDALNLLEAALRHFFDPTERELDKTANRVVKRRGALSRVRKKK